MHRNQTHRQRTNREARRGGFQTRPASADPAPRYFLGPPLTARDDSRCQRECDL